MTTNERAVQRLENFSKTVALLKKACETPIQDERDLAGIIQFFEMAIELSWKCCRDYLLLQQFEDPITPKASIQSALTHRIISLSESESWLKGLSMRNITSHTYDEESAQATVNDIQNQYLPFLQRIVERLST